MTKTKTLSPRQARTWDQLCSLRRDNSSWGDWWILTDGLNVAIYQQKPGETSTQEISIPIGTFNRLIDWYQRPQKTVGQP